MAYALRQPVNALIHDNLDDRREIHRLLTRLSPACRMEFLRWCCRHARHGSTHPETQPGTRGEALEVFFDWWALVLQYDLDIEASLNRLVKMVRKNA